MTEQGAIYETSGTVMENLFDIAGADSRELADARAFVEKGTDAISRAGELAAEGDLIGAITFAHAPESLPSVVQIELARQLATQVIGVLTGRTGKSAMSYKDRTTVERAGIVVRISTEYIESQTPPRTA
jgi:hypothetical protein